MIIVPLTTIKLNPIQAAARTKVEVKPNAIFDPESSQPLEELPED